MNPPVAPGQYRLVNLKSKTCLDVDEPPAPDALVVGWAVDAARTSQIVRALARRLFLP